MTYKVCLPKAQYDNIANGFQRAVIMFDQEFNVDDILNVYCENVDDSTPIKTIITNVTKDIDIYECSVLVSIKLYNSDEDKHWAECRMISEYEMELKELRSRILDIYNNSSESLSSLINFLD